LVVEIFECSIVTIIIIARRSDGALYAA